MVVSKQNGARRVAAAWTEEQVRHDMGASWRRRERGCPSLVRAYELARAMMAFLGRRVGGIGGAERGANEVARFSVAEASGTGCVEVASKMAQEVARNWCEFGAGRGRRKDKERRVVA